MAFSQGTILNLSNRIKELLSAKLLSGNERSIKRVKDFKKKVISRNRSRLWKIKKLRKKLLEEGLSKADAKEIIHEINDYERGYVNPKDIQNIIDKQEGKDFMFNIRMSGFTTELWGKKRSTVRINSKQINKLEPLVIERKILTRWKDAIERGIEDLDEGKQKDGLIGILLTVIAHLDYINGDMSAEELDEYLKDEGLYYVLADIDPARAVISIFAAAGASKR